MDAFYPVQGSSRDALRGKTLILPSVSLANLPQLAVDLLITSLDLSRIGYIGDGSTVVPLFGTDTSGAVTGGLEVYGREGLDVVVIQQRSPVIKSRKEEHVDLLKQFASSSGFSFILIVTSLDAANQDDLQLLTPHQYILPPSSTSLPIVSRLREILPPLNLNLDSGSSSRTPSYPPFLPSAGLTRRILIALSESPSPAASGPAHGVISAWCVEADNRLDARYLAETVLRVLALDDVKITEPESWKGLFGTTEGWSGGSGQDSELYG